MKNDKTWVCPNCKQTYPYSQTECWQCWHNYYLQLKQKEKQEKQEKRDGVQM